MSNFEIKEDYFNQTMSKYVDIVGATGSLLVASYDFFDEDCDGNPIEAVIDEDKMHESLNKSFTKWMKENAADVTIEFPAQRWVDDSDEPEEYTATMKLSDFDWSATFGDDGYYGGLQLQLTAYAPDDNEDFDNEDSIEPVVLLAAWKIETLLNADAEFWNTLCCEAYDDSVSYEIMEEEAA